MSVKVERILLVIVAALLLVGGLATWAQGLGRDNTVSADFAAGVGVYVGSDVRVRGVPVGRITAVEPRPSGVAVTMEIDKDSRIAAGTSAVVVAPSLVSDRYVQLVGAARGVAALKDGARIPRDRTATPTELDQTTSAVSDLVKALGPKGANADGAFSDLLDTAAKNLDGNGTRMNSAVRDLGRTANSLNTSEKDLFGTIGNLERFNDMLLANDAEVVKVNSQLARVSGSLAQDRKDFDQAVTELGQALAQVDTFVKDNREAIGTNVTKLNTTAQVLASNKDDLEGTLSTLPVALQNFLDAYDPTTNTLSARANLNDISIWASTQDAGGKGSSAPTPSGAGAQPDLPPLMLPALEAVTP